MLTDIYSPVHQLRHFSRKNIWVKRDDLIDPYISGNKWRKLKYILEEARNLKKDHLVTFGGTYSNHLVATAAACARHGLKSTGFVRGEVVENEMLLLCRLYGMNLIFCTRTDYKDKEALFNTYFLRDRQAFFVDEGGAGIHAEMGCAEIINELPTDVDHLFCAAGTGTTAAGLLKGILDSRSKMILHVVPVLKGGLDFITRAIRNYSGGTAQVVIHEDYHFGGYAKTKPELIYFMKRFIAEEGMLIDPVYTAKMFFAIDDLLGKQRLKATDKIAAVHTGGLLGIWGMKEKFRPDD